MKVILRLVRRQCVAIVIGVAVLCTAFPLSTSSGAAMGANGSTAGQSTGAYVCGPRLNATLGSGLISPSDPSTLYESLSTDCDDSANRFFSQPAVAGAIAANRHAMYPSNVVTNPDECSNPSPAYPTGSSSVEVDVEIYGDYIGGELVTFADPAVVVSAVRGLALQQGWRAQPTLTVVGSIDVPGLAGIDGLDPLVLRGSSDGRTLYRLQIAAPPGEVAIDALLLSNLLFDSGIFARPNFVFVTTPGAQHSPANEPVPFSSSSMPSISPAHANAAMGTSVVVIDTDFNANKPPMSGVAGHMTFVSGVIRQLAPGAQVEEAEFGASTGVGARNNKSILSDWDLTELLIEHADAGVINLSAGAYSCQLPVGSSRGSAGSGVGLTTPLGILAATAFVQTKDTLIVAAAGNDASDQPFWPAGLADEPAFADTVVGVKALDEAGDVAGFSNLLPASAACALGVDVRSDYLSGDYEYSTGGLAHFDGAAIWSGTSFATPHITSMYLRLLADGVEVADAREQLLATCD